MSDKSPPLSAEQIEFACRMMRQWLEICEDNNRNLNAASIDHSSLLRRLLSGKKALSAPPPMRFGYPAWELVEAEEIEIQEITDDEQGLQVDHHGGYSWIDKDKKLIQYDRLQLQYQYLERDVIPDASVVKEGLDPKDFKYTAKFLKKLSQP